MVVRKIRAVLLLSLGMLATVGAFTATSTETRALAGEKPDGAKVFRAGAYAMDTTPLEFPISVNGGMTDRLAKSAHDPMHARCLVLDDGTTKLAIVVVDACMIERDIFEEAKRLAQEATGIPASNMLMSATHTHSAPTATGIFQSDSDVKYQKFLIQRIAEGVAKAHSQLEPARIGWAVGSDPTQVFNRRWKMKPGTIPPDPFGNTTDTVKMNPGYMNPGLIEPAGPVDPEVSIVSIQARDGRPIALLANYSLHYVGGAPGSMLSADYFAAFANRIGELIGATEAKPAFVGIMSNGTSGDINNNNYGAPAGERKPPYGQITFVADSVARAAYEAYKTIEYHDWVSLAAKEKDIELGVRHPGEADIARAKEILAAAQGPVLRGLVEVYARETVLLSKYPKTVPVKLQALRIGDLGIAAIPCETFVEIGLQLKKESPLKPTFTIELANGYNGYLPTPQQHAWGGYETWRARSSYLEVEAAPKIVETVLELLNEVAKK